MAHFAEIDENNIVLRVLVVPDNEEYRGEQFLTVDLLLGGHWVQCSYNGRIRKNYPGPGFAYDHVRDAFIPPKPFPSWILNEQQFQWEPPVPMPKGNPHDYLWDESTISWRAVEHA